METFTLLPFFYFIVLNFTLSSIVLAFIYYSSLSEIMHSKDLNFDPRSIILELISAFICPK